MSYSFARQSSGEVILHTDVNELQQAIEDIGNDYVTGTTAQTVTGAKRFSADVAFGSGRPWVDVTHPSIGAVANDTSKGTVNVTAINAALTAAAALNSIAGGGCRVYIPAGTYTLAIDNTTWIVLKSGVEVFGDGAATLLTIQDDNGDYQRIFGGTANTTTLTDVALRHLVVDQNAAGNTTAQVSASVANQAQYVLRLGGASARIEVERCQFDYCGNNAILIAGSSANIEDVRIVHNDFRFHRAATDQASPRYYDTTAVYVAASRFLVGGNTFEATIADDADTAIQVTGGSGVVRANQIVGFAYGITITSAAAAYDELAGDSGIIVAHNPIRQCRWGVQLWSNTGYRLKNVVVEGNTIDVAQLTWNYSTGIGVGITNVASGVAGAYQDLSIIGNVISFETGDTRATDQQSVAISTTYNAGISLTPAMSLTVDGFVVLGNTVRDAPGHSYYIGHASSGATLQNGKVASNLALNGGRNSSLAAASRVGLVLTGTLIDVQVEHQQIIDTGTPTSFGGYSVLASSNLTATRVYLSDCQVSDPSGNLLHSVDRTKAGDWFNTATVDVAAIAPGAASATQTLAVLGASTQDLVLLQPNLGLESGLIPYAWVSAAGTVSWKLFNATSGTIDPANRAFRALVLKPGSGKL